MERAPKVLLRGMERKAPLERTEATVIACDVGWFVKEREKKRFDIGG